MRANFYLYLYNKFLSCFLNVDIDIVVPHVWKSEHYIYLDILTRVIQ